MEEKNIKQAQKLIKDINKKISTWNERSQFKIKGIGNLSMADLDSLVLYAEALIKNDGYDFGGLMNPIGEVKDVLKQYQLVA